MFISTKKVALRIKFGLKAFTFQIYPYAQAIIRKINKPNMYLKCVCFIKTFFVAVIQRVNRNPFAIPFYSFLYSRTTNQSIHTINCVPNN